MSRFKLHKLLFLILILMLFGCARQGTAVDEAKEIQVDLTIQPSPPAMGEATLDLQLEDEQGIPVEGAVLEVKGDMTHAGMVPVLGTFDEVEGGLYHADFEWTMGGDWILTITGTLPDGRNLLRTFDIIVSSEMK
jgi:hypothetical protein